MKSTQTLLKTLLISVFLLQACGKDNPAKEEDKTPIETEKPVSLTNKLRAYTNNTADLPNFIYNSDGTLANQFSYNKGKPYYRISHSYKNKQRVASNYFSDVQLGDTLTLFMKLEYTWTGDHITALLEDSPYINYPNGSQGANRELTTFNYDGNGFLKSCKTEIILNGTKTLKSDRRFVTDAEGDIIKAEEDRYYQGVFQETLKESYQYDDKINPEWKLQSPMGLATFFSSHNVVKQTFENFYSTVSTYKYNTSGLPVELFRAQGNGINSYLYYNYYQ